MAKASGVNSQFKRGQIGPEIWKVVNGKQIVYQAPEWDLTKTRTEASLEVNNKIARLSSVSKAFKEVIHDTFEKKDRGSTMAGMFIHNNWDTTQAYLTRKEIAAGMQLLEPFCLSQGPLEPPIHTYEQDGNLVSNICVGDLVIDDRTTLNQLAWAILQNAKGFSQNERESILFVRAIQLPAMGKIKPRVLVKKYQFEVRTTDLDQPSPTVRSCGLTDGFYTVPVVDAQGQRRNFLCCPIEPYTGACWIHSRLAGRNAGDQRLISTTQSLDGLHNPLLADYITELAKTVAFNSYGGINKHISNSPNNPGPEAPEERPELPNVPVEPEVTLSQYALYAIASPAQGGTVTGSGIYDVGSDIELAATNANGWHFTEWNDGFDEPTRTIQMPAAPTTLTAYFAPDTPAGGDNSGGTGGDGGNSGNADPTQVRLTFAVNNSALGEVAPASGLFDVGSTIQAVATPKTDAEFIGWTDGVNTATRTIQVPAEPQTYTANFRSTGGGGGSLELGY